MVLHLIDAVGEGNRLSQVALHRRPLVLHDSVAQAALCRQPQPVEVDFLGRVGGLAALVRDQDKLRDGGTPAQILVNLNRWMHPVERGQVEQLFAHRHWHWGGWQSRWRQGVCWLAGSQRTSPHGT